ncbi:MAG: hypothetical protein ACRD9W_19090, partial [Terriglobia bacterium]
GNAVEIVRLDRDGKPIDLNGKSSLWRNSYDPNTGRLLGEAFYNSAGAKMSGAGGYWRVEYSHDRFGNETADTYFDVDDHPLGQQRAPEGPGQSSGAQSAKAGEASGIGAGKSEALPVAKWTARYDEHGNQVEVRRLDWRGQPVPKEKDIALERIDYDRDGRRIRHIYYDESEQPTPDSDGDIAYAFEYDPDGNRMATHYFDAELKPAAPPKRQHATTRFKYDESGNEIDEAYFDTDGKPVGDKDGITEISYSYVDGLESEAIWYGKDRQRVVNSNRYSRRHTDYDRYGRVSEYHYYDAEDRPMHPPDAAPTVRVLYDQNGNKISRVNLDERGNPVDLDGWAEWIDEFDRNNRLVRTLYFNAAGRPATGTDRYAIGSWRYDDDGDKVRSEYLGPDWKPVAGPEGYA